MDTKSVVQLALEVLEPIPEDQFCTGEYWDRETNQCCSLGHFNRLTSSNPGNYLHSNGNWRGSREVELRSLVSKFLTEKGNFDDRGVTVSITTVNDRPLISEYKQKTPKKRVVKLLTDMVNQGY